MEVLKPVFQETDLQNSTILIATSNRDKLGSFQQLGAGFGLRVISAAPETSCLTEEEWQQGAFSSALQPYTPEVMAWVKAANVAKERPGQITVGCDTVRLIRLENGEVLILQKPQTSSEAVSQLVLQAGNEVEQYAAVCYMNKRTLIGTVRTTMRINNIYPGDAETYVANNPPEFWKVPGSFPLTDQKAWQAFCTDRELQVQMDCYDLATGQRTYLTPKKLSIHDEREEIFAHMNGAVPELFQVLLNGG